MARIGNKLYSVRRFTWANRFFWLILKAQSYYFILKLLIKDEYWFFIANFLIKWFWIAPYQPLEAWFHSRVVLLYSPIALHHSALNAYWIPWDIIDHSVSWVIHTYNEYYTFFASFFSDFTFVVETLINHWIVSIILLGWYQFVKQISSSGTLKNLV